MAAGTQGLSIDSWTGEECSVKEINLAVFAVYGLSENEKFSLNTMFVFVVLNMEVSSCCLPSSVQCGAADNPQGFCSNIFSSSHVYFFVVCFGIPSAVLFILQQHVSQVLSEDLSLRETDSEKKKGRDVGTLRKGVRDTERVSFERLLTSKLTVIVTLARGESTFKHTG